MNPLQRVIHRIINEPVAIVAGLTAAANSVTTETWEGYAVAAVVFLLRFVVTGPVTEPSLPKVGPPEGSETDGLDGPQTF